MIVDTIQPYASCVAMSWSVRPRTIAVTYFAMNLFCKIRIYF